MGNLTNIKFWFNIYPAPLSEIGIKVFVALIALFVFTTIINKILILRTKEKLHRRALRKVFTLLSTNVFLLSLIMFLMYEAVPFLSSRFWFLILILIDGLWLYFIYKFYKTIPSQKEEREKEKEFVKYIP